MVGVMDANLEAMLFSYHKTIYLARICFFKLKSFRKRF